MEIMYNKDYRLTTKDDQPVLLDHNGKTYGPSDMVDSGLFGMTRAADETSSYRRFENAAEAALMAKWYLACSQVKPLTESQQYFVDHNLSGES